MFRATRTWTTGNQRSFWQLAARAVPFGNIFYPAARAESATPETEKWSATGIASNLRKCT
jgi:hypothetical protein